MLAGLIGILCWCFFGTLFAAIRDIRLLVGVPRSCLELPHSYSACVRCGCAVVWLAFESELRHGRSVRARVPPRSNIWRRFSNFDIVNPMGILSDIDDDIGKWTLLQKSYRKCLRSMDSFAGCIQPFVKRWVVCVACVCYLRDDVLWRCAVTLWHETWWLWETTRSAIMLL